MNSIIKKIAIDWSVIKALALRLLLVMFLFTLCRIGFFAFNSSYFPGMTFPKFIRIMWGGLRFDLTAVLYVNAIFIILNLIPFQFRANLIYQKVLKYIFIVTNGIALAMNTGDFIYYRFISKRTTYDVFETFSNEAHMGKLFFQFMLDFWYVVVVWGLLVFGMVYLYDKVKIKKLETKSNIIYFSSNTLMLLLSAYLIIAGIRGGFAHSIRPITLSNAGKYVEKPAEMSIVLNTPFSIIRTLNKKLPERVAFFETEQELNAIFNPVHSGKTGEVMEKQNVFIIILESFGKEYFGALNPHLEKGNYKGYTPFLDSLIQESMVFPNAYCNGRKSIDALPSVISSIPQLQYPFVLSPFSGNDINSFASLLKPKGYQTAYFHNAPNGSMGFEAFVNVVGFEQYFGKDEYGNDDDYDGMWGIWDEPFFQFTADEINKLKQPFVGVLQTISSHHPFRVPEQYKGKFDKGTLPIHQCIGYTDLALKKFFAKAKKMPWFENTLFVFTADHTSQIQFPEYRTSVGLYAVPIIFYKPNSDLKGQRHYEVQQTDILPTVLNYLNFDEPFVAFGNDMLNDSAEHFAVNNVDGVYQLIKGGYALHFDGKKSVGLYHYKKDRLQQENILGKAPTIQFPMEEKIKAIIQQYNIRMLDNDLVVK